jgi:hypothetical protein
MTATNRTDVAALTNPTLAEVIYDYAYDLRNDRCENVEHSEWAAATKPDVPFWGNGFSVVFHAQHPCTPCA